jgi:hypothetical protein
MVHIFNKKSDFDLMLNMATTRLFGSLRKYWNCNSRTYLWTVKSESNKTHFMAKITFIGFSSDTFSDSRQGLFFGENTTISDIRKVYPFVADEIEKYMHDKKSLYQFQIGR